jgi:Holliday junction DNA helicase RuvB
MERTKGRHDQDLTPLSLTDFMGQEQIKKNLSVAMTAAKKRCKPLDHTLLCGPAGLGKTALAHIIANEMGVNIRSISGPAISRIGDLAIILNALEEKDILFIDEIHRLNAKVQESLYPIMEKFYMNVVGGKGPDVKAVDLYFPKFTLVAATTRFSLLSAPLRGRFGMTFTLNSYSEDVIGDIIRRSVDILYIKMDDEAVNDIASCSRGVPRIANQLLRRVGDYAEVKVKSKMITGQVARQALREYGIDEKGLHEMDRRIVLTIIREFGGGPVGLSTVASRLGEEPGALSEIYEPYLLQIGFLQRTPRGRIATELAHKQLGISKQ